MSKILYILTLIIIFTKTANSYELLSNSHLKVSLKTYALPNGYKFSIYEGEGTWTDNYGNYGTSTCRGVVKTDDLNKTKNKKFEVTKYQAKSSFNITKFFSYILVSIISFVALIILIDTFKSVLYVVFPGLELMIFSLFETLKDIQLFIKDLI